MEKNYEKIVKIRGYQPNKLHTEGHKPVKPISSTPPNQGSRVQTPNPAPKK